MNSNLPILLIIGVFVFMFGLGIGMVIKETNASKMVETPKVEKPVGWTVTDELFRPSNMEVYGFVATVALPWCHMLRKKQSDTTTT